MLSAKDNETLTRVGPGTLMGDLFRQYWLPVFKSEELPSPDCPPVRVRILGENLIGFRTTSGSVGLVVDACPHRGASLFFGRNEEGGLRCVYHGWKFDEAGACVDMPSEPAESNFKSKVRATAYRCRERNGVIWTYMGTREVPPELPDLEPNMMPEGSYSVQKALRDCNWMQGMEGDIDTSHLSFLHLGALRLEDTNPGSFDYYLIKDRAPKYDVIDTDVGTSYAAYRPAEPDTMYFRLAHFLFPCYVMIPTGDLGTQILVRSWVPIDDEHMMFWNMSVPSTRSIGQGGAGARRIDNPNNRQAAATTGANRGGFGGFQYLPDQPGWLGKWRLTQNRDNDYRLDRELQKTSSYTGIPGIHQQDQAITESMGPVYDRSHEHLGTSDSMVIRTRRRLINAARALRNEGVVPPGVDNPAGYRLRSGGVILPRGADWIAATAELQQAFVDHGAAAKAPEAIAGGGS